VSLPVSQFELVLIGEDYGTDGVSAPIGSCVKIWLLYPPSPENLRLVLGTEGQRAKLARVALYLKGGIILKTTSAEAIYLPAGCIHATFTIEGGYLVAVDFTTMDSMKAFSAYIASGLDRFLGAEGQLDCFQWFTACLELALAGDRVKEVLEGWIQAQNRIQDCVHDATDSRSDWVDHLRTIWESFLGTYTTFIACPCDATNATQATHSHLTATHLRSLYPEVKKSTRPKNSRKTTPSQKAASLAVRRRAADDSSRVADDSSDSEYLP
jgi:hypothetical protein